jgi:hypothetical protein
LRFEPRRYAIPREHTLKAKQELPGLPQGIVAPLQAQRVAQNQKLMLYKKTALCDEDADHIVWRVPQGHHTWMTALAKQALKLQRPRP